MIDATPGMFTRAGLLMLHERTHERLALLIRHTGTLPPEAFVRELPGFGMGSVRHQLVHILNCERGWMHDLEDRTFEPRPKDEYTTAAMIESHRQIVASETRDLFGRLSEDRINARLEKRPEAWMGDLRSPAFTLLHTLTHAYHHKGQIVAMCRLLGSPAPDTDLQN